MIAHPKSTPSSWDRAFLPKVLLIIVAGFWVFSPVFHGDWLWDDGLLIRQNEVVHDPAGLWEIWFEPHRLIDYLPVTVSVEWLEWHLWHADTLGYHLTNVAFHVLNALLVWHLFSKFRLRLAWVGGLLFAIHPVTVESVAWIAELKNTLSLPFFLIAMCAWIDYDRLGKRGDYFRALGFFLVAMLCKATMVMFPFVILLYAWWRHGQVSGKDLAACAPFFLISLTLGIITLKFLHPAMDVASVLPVSPLSRIALAGSTLAFYFFKCILPINLLPIYPKWSIDPPAWMLFLPWLILIGVVAGCWKSRRAWGKDVLLGLGFFLITIAPFLGFTQGAYMSFTWVMDHLLYIPLIGLIGLAVAGCEQIEAKLSKEACVPAVGAVVLSMLFLAFESHGYAAVFRNQEQLWSYTLQGNPDSDVAHNNLGLVYLNSNRLPLAIEQFDEALRLNSTYSYAHNGLGNALFESGRTAEAIDHYHEALKIDPEYPEAHNGLGNALLATGHLDEAQKEFAESLKLNPHYVDAHCNLGLIYAQQGRVAEAIAEFETAEKLSPADPRIEQELELLRNQQKATGK